MLFCRRVACWWCCTPTPNPLPFSPAAPRQCHETPQPCSGSTPWGECTWHLAPGIWHLASCTWPLGVGEEGLAREVELEGRRWFSLTTMTLPDRARVSWVISFKLVLYQLQKLWQELFTLPCLVKKHGSKNILTQPMWILPTKAAESPVQQLCLYKR